MIRVSSLPTQNCHTVIKRHSSNAQSDQLISIWGQNHGKHFNRTCQGTSKRSLRQNLELRNLLVIYSGLGCELFIILFRKLFRHFIFFVMRKPNFRVIDLFESLLCPNHSLSNKIWKTNSLFKNIRPAYHISYPKQNSAASIILFVVFCSTIHRPNWVLSNSR